VEPADGPSLLLGFLSARHQLGTIEVAPSHGGGHALIAATELDGVALEDGAEVASEPLLILDGKTSDLLDVYTRSVAEAMDARAAHEVLSGWCSWYQLYTTVTEADVDRNLKTLLEHREQLPLRLVQLDDGYQRAIGDWLELNEKFLHGMRPLVQRVRNAGFLPGLWLAPFLLSAESDTYAEHPDWVVRDELGDPLNAIDNWGTANYAVDTTHPEALRWLEHVLRTVCEDWGYEYVKLDFLYAAAMRGRRFDPQVTGVEAYRRGLEVLRQAVGERFILGCGAPLVPSIGLVDGMRIGSDVASYWGEEGNSDGPALRNAMRATLARLWMHGRWWSNDPDVVVVRANDSQLSFAEVQAWAAVVALSGGMLFEGDDLSRVEPARRELLARLLPPSGEAARAFPPLVELMPERLVLRVQRAWSEWYVIGVANWSDAEADVRFDPFDSELDLGLYHVFDLWSGAYLGRHSSALDLGALPPHSMRLLSVHPDLGRPQTIGSSGHLLGEAMDLAAEEWDPAAGVLTLIPSDRGPRSRRSEFVVYDPRGPLQRVPFSAADARPITLHFT
jgi:alpha-galactosidase